MDLQAIRYAAMVAHMTFAQAVDAHERYLARRGIEGGAEARILEHLGADDGAEPEIASARPRILLAARDFPRELTTAVLWLRDSGLDVRCVRLLPYRVGGALLLDAAQIIPLPEAEDYLVRIRSREAEQEHRTWPDMPWTREDIERLAGLITSTLTLWLLDGFAVKPGEWISMGEIRARWNEGHQEERPEARFAAGELRGLARLVHREFGRDNWPFDFDYRDGGDSRSYRMTAGVAEWWRAARGVRIRDREAEQGQTYPDIPWTREDIERLAGLVANTLTLWMLDIFAESPEEWVSLSAVRARGSEEQRADWPDAHFAAGSLAGLTRLVRREFGRDNWPFDFDYRDGGDSRSCRMAAEAAEWWRAARAARGGGAAGEG